MATLQRKLGSLWFCIKRLKTTSLTESAYAKEPRFHTIFDLVLVGLVMMLPLSVFVLSGSAARDLAGPSSVLAALFAAMASGLAGLSYSELRARVYRLQAPAYEYTYRVVGEMAAFMVGWLILLHHVMCSSAISCVVSQSLDYVLDGHISNFTEETVGKVPHFDTQLDFLGMFVCLLAMIAALVDIDLTGRITNIVLTSICVFVLLFALVVGLYHLDFHHWQTVEDFFPNGIGGVMAAAAVLNYGFWGSEAVLRSCDMNCRGVRKPAMMSIVIVHISMLIVFILFISTLTLLTANWTSTSPFPEAYTNAGTDWMKYIICTGAILVLPPVLLWQAKEAVKSLSLLASDGIIPGAFATKHPRTNTQVVSTVVAGISSSACALLFSVTALVQVLAVPIIVMQMTACAVTVFFHYKAEQDEAMIKPKKKRRKKVGSPQSSSSVTGALGTEASVYGSTQGGQPETVSNQNPDLLGPMIDGRSSDPSVVSNNNNIQEPESSDTDIDDIVEEYTQEQRVREITANASPSDFRRRSTVTSYRRVCVAFVVFAIFTLGMGLIVTKGSDQLTERNVGVIVLLFITLAVMCIAACVIGRQPRDSIQPYTVKLYVPHVPWTPLVALVMNVMMFAGVGCVPAVTVCIWGVTGVFIYIFYGIKHSHESHIEDHFPAEHRGLIHGATAPLHRSRSAPKVVLDISTPETVYHVDARDDDALLDF